MSGLYLKTKHSLGFHARRQRAFKRHRNRTLQQYPLKHDFSGLAGDIHINLGNDLHRYAILDPAEYLELERIRTAGGGHALLVAGQPQLALFIQGGKCHRFLIDIQFNQRQMGRNAQDRRQAIPDEATGNDMGPG